MLVVFSPIFVADAKLHSRGYLKKTSIKINVATNEGNSGNEIGHWANDETGVAVQS